MSAFDSVHVRVKPGYDDVFLESYRSGKANWPGLTEGHIIKSGEQSYCLIGCWPNQVVMAEAMSAMIATLEIFCDILGDQGPGKRARTQLRVRWFWK